MRPLYDIIQDIIECQRQLIDETTGEVKGDYVDFERLNSLELEKDTKVENIALWYKDMSAEATAIKAEEERLKARRTTLENKCESLKNYLKEALDGEKFKTARCAISFRNTEVADITIDPQELPDLYKRTKMTVEPDKSAIKKALQAGEEIEGCALTISQSISIK